MEEEKEGESLATLSKAEVQALITSKSDRVKLTPNTVGKSEVWKKFDIINIDGQQQEFVLCKNCQSVLTWKSFNTSGLRRHSCSGAAGSPAVTPQGGQMNLDQLQRRPAPATAVTKLNKDITVGLAADLRPLSAVEGRGFNLIAQQLINFGARHGFQKASDVLQSRVTLKSYLPGLVDMSLNEIKAKIRRAPSYPKYSFTTDMWSDQYKQQSFISLSIHYLDEDFQLRTHMLAVDQFPDIPKSTENVRGVCRQILERYFDESANLVIDSSIAITDGGSNMIKAFPTRHPCLCHKLNLVVGWIFNESNPGSSRRTTLSEKKQFVFKNECPRLHGAMVGVRNVVTFFKRSGLNNRLKNSLKQDVSTRWNSQLVMLESYLRSMSEVKKILFERNQIEKAAIDDGAVQELISFLQPFKECTEAWSHDKQPSIHKVVVWVEDLIAHVADKEEDSEDIIKLKGQARTCIAEYLKLDDIYYIAAGFDPTCKKLKFLEKGKRDEVDILIRKLINEVTDIVHPPQARTTSDNTADDQGAPLRKIPRMKDYADSSDSENDEPVIKHEYDRYLELRVSKEGFNLLKFWKDCSGLPAMRRIASWLLAIPASQTSDERVFSTTGSTLTARRTAMKGSTLSSLTYIYKNHNI